PRCRSEPKASSRSRGRSSRPCRFGSRVLRGRVQAQVERELVRNAERLALERRELVILEAHGSLAGAALDPRARDAVTPIDLERGGVHAKLETKIEGKRDQQRRITQHVDARPMSRAHLMGSELDQRLRLAVPSNRREPR